MTEISSRDVYMASLMVFKAMIMVMRMRTKVIAHAIFVPPLIMRVRASMADLF